MNVDAIAEDQGDRDLDPLASRSKWPPFPWNPPTLDNPLFGREDALAELGHVFDAVVTDWAVRIQLVASDYGLGKSRLLAAFARAARQREPATSTIEVRCPSQGGGGGPYRLWDAVLRAAFHISPSADAADAGHAIERATARYLAPDAVPFIAHLVGQPLERVGAVDEEALMARCVSVLARLFEAIAFETPLLLVVDDANRATARDFAIASALATTCKGHPIMLVLAGSGNLVDHLPGWDRFPVTRLYPLGRADAERMLRLYLTGLAASPSRALIERILTTAAGNSYAIKAMVRWLRESGAIAMRDGRWTLDEAHVATRAVPDTLEAVIHARIGTLDHAERALLAQAAVVGKEFWIGSLVALARQSVTEPPDSYADDATQVAILQRLKRLVEQKFIEPRQTRIRSEDCFAFRSPVHWEAALEGLPGTTRQRWHRVILSWLELQAEGLEVPNEGVRGMFLRELARHAEGAGHLPQAAVYYLRAARIALAEGHSRAALHALDEALRLVQPEQLAIRLRVLFDLGEVHALSGTTDLALEAFGEALALAWRLGDRRRAASALARIADIRIARGDTVAARKDLLDALRLQEAMQDSHGVAHTCIQLGRMHWMQGEFDKAVLVYRKSEHIYRRLEHEQGIAEVLHVQGAIQMDRGDLRLAERYYQDALVLRKKVGDQRGIVRTLNNLGAIWMSQRLEQSVEVWREALAIAREIGDLGLQAMLTDNLGEALVLLGRHDEASEMLDRAIELAEVTGNKATLVDALRNQALLAIARGTHDAAQVSLTRAQELAESLGLARLDALVMRAKGDLAFARMEATGVLELSEAEASYQRAAEGFARAGYNVEAASAYERLAEMLALAGRTAEQATVFARAQTLRAQHAHTAEPPPVPM